MGEEFRRALDETAAQIAELVSGGSPSVVQGLQNGMLSHTAPSFEIPLGNTQPPPAPPAPDVNQVSQTTPGRTEGWGMGARSVYDQER